MSTMVPQDVEIRANGEVIARVPNITLIMWEKALHLQVKHGLQVARGSTTSAIVKRYLGLPKNMRVVEVYAIVKNLVAQYKGEA